MTTLSDPQRRRLVRLATGLHEQLQGWRPGAPPTEASADRARRFIAGWKRAVGEGDPAAFAERLAWSGLDEARALERLSGFEPPSDCPGWIFWIDTLLAEAARASAELRESGTLIELNRDAELAALPYAEVWVPVTRAATGSLDLEQIADSAGISTPALRALERQLATEVARIAELAVDQAYRESVDREPAEDAYASFVAEFLATGYGPLLERYPVLARDLARLAETWTTGTMELCARLRRDRPQLTETFASGADPGEVTSVRAGLSDRHHDGRRVVILRFASDLQVVYKPRDVGVEAAFHEALRRLAAEGFPDAPRALKVLQRTGYGWIEFARASPCPDRASVRRFFRRAGALWCLTWVLRAQDLHMENVIASGDQPILVDPEMLLQPVRSGMRGVAEESCLGTGFLSMLVRSDDGSVHDIGALRGRGGSSLPVPQRVWHDVGTSRIGYREEPTVVPRRDNLPCLDGEPARTEDHAAELLAGFEAAGRYLIDQRDALLADGSSLGALSGVEIRVLLRDSKRYAALLHTLAHPRYQDDALSRSLLFETLQPTAEDATDGAPALWPLIEDERAAIDGLDVPRFTLPANATTLTSSGGEGVTGDIEVSGWEAARERIAALDEAELAAQLEWIRLALDGGVDARFACPADPVNEALERDAAAGFFAAARWIGAELLERAERDGEGVPHWRFLDPEAGRTTGAEPLHLYNGAIGPALFLAALGAVTGESRWSYEARAIVASLLPRLADPAAAAERDGAMGLCEGVGSVVWTAGHLSVLLGDPAVRDVARAAARAIDTAAIDAADCLDLVGGVAGTALALLDLAAADDDPDALDRAGHCGRRLLDAAETESDGGLSWRAPDGRKMAGLAHGTAGIALALARLFEATGDERYRDAGRAACRYERRVYAAALARRSPGVAPELRLVAWCHGPAGIALGRAAAFRALDDPALSQDVAHAVEVTRRTRPSRTDHLCCGNLGRAEALLVLGQRGNPQLTDAARGLTMHVLQRALTAGAFGLPSSAFEHRVFAPGFFRGLSGIGYQLLRAVRPERLPSILALEPTAPVETAETRTEGA